MNPKTLIALALRGLLRNRRRGLVTLLAIAFGFAAIALFAGYTHNIYRGLSLQAIHGELLGHLSLSKRGMSREGKLDPERYLMTAEEVRHITELVRAEPHVTLVTQDTANVAQAEQNEFFNTCVRRVAPYGNAYIIKGASPEVASEFPDNFFDFVYVPSPMSFWHQHFHTHTPGNAHEPSSSSLTHSTYP